MARKDHRTFETPRIATVIREAEALFKTSVITYESMFDNPENRSRPGGMCSCCGAGPRIAAPDDWRLIFRAGLTDGDGVYYGMLCDRPDRDGCLTDIRRENDRRDRTARDEAASLISDLMGDDLDGAQAFMDDLEFLDGFDEF